MTDNLTAVLWLLDHGMVPKRLRHRAEAKRREEVLGNLKHPQRAVVLKYDIRLMGSISTTIERFAAAAILTQCELVFP